MFSQVQNPIFFRATLAREARNRLNYWREAAREARFTPEISQRRRASRATLPESPNRLPVTESTFGRVSPDSGFGNAPRIDLYESSQFEF